VSNFYYYYYYSFAAASMQTPLFQVRRFVILLLLPVVWAAPEGTCVPWTGACPACNVPGRRALTFKRAYITEQSPFASWNSDLRTNRVHCWWYFYLNSEREQRPCVPSHPGALLHYSHRDNMRHNVAAVLAVTQQWYPHPGKQRNTISNKLNTSYTALSARDMQVRVH